MVSKWVIFKMLTSLVRVGILSMEDDMWYEDDTPLNIWAVRYKASVDDIHMFEQIVDGTWW